MPFDSPLHLASVAALLVGVVTIGAGLGLAIGGTAGRSTVSDRTFLRYIALVPLGMVFLVLALIGAFTLTA